MSHAPAARIPAPWGKWGVPSAAILAVLVWLAGRYPWGMGGPDIRGYEEYKLPDATPVALAVAGDRSAVWFTLESSDAIGVLRNGRLAFVHKDFESIEPLGLAIDVTGAA